MSTTVARSHTRVRSARPEELPAVGALTVRAYAAVGGLSDGEDDYTRELADPTERARTCKVLVATDGASGEALGGEILGTVTYVPGPGPYAEFPEPDWAGIRMLAVAPEAWGRGVGSALVRACISRAEADGRAGIALHTTEEMAAAARLYPRLGFRRAPERDWTTPGGTLLLGYAWRNPDRHDDAVGATHPAPEPAKEGLQIDVVAGDAPAIVALVDDLMTELRMRYGDGDGTHDRFRPADAGEGGCVLLARLDDRPVGAATLRPRSGGDAELKRMVVDVGVRGRGVGRALLAAVEDTARDLGYVRLVLETGIRQPEAIRLYRRAGYVPIEPYGWYRSSSLSRCFAKIL